MQVVFDGFVCIQLHSSYALVFRFNINCKNFERCDKGECVARYSDILIIWCVLPPSHAGSVTRMMTARLTESAGGLSVQREDQRMPDVYYI